MGVSVAMPATARVYRGGGGAVPLILGATRAALKTPVVLCFVLFARPRPRAGTREDPGVVLGVFVVGATW